MLLWIRNFARLKRAEIHTYFQARATRARTENSAMKFLASLLEEGTEAKLYFVFARSRGLIQIKMRLEK